MVADRHLTRAARSTRPLETLAIATVSIPWSWVREARSFVAGEGVNARVAQHSFYRAPTVDETLNRRIRRDIKSASPCRIGPGRGLLGRSLQRLSAQSLNREKVPTNPIRIRGTIWLSIRTE